MKSLSSLALIAMVLFACKLCSLTGNDNKPTSSPTPTPQPLLYAGDLIKQRLGEFSLIKHATKEEMKKTASGFGVQLLNQANDAGVGEYRSDEGKTALLSVYSFATPQGASAIVDQLEQEGRNPKSRTAIISSTQTANGKRLEALGMLGRKRQAMVVWNNGYWLFMAISAGIADARALEKAVGD